ncbi:hypothetical protein RND81_05G064700 [Saponaria officinalis]|uniref:THH1/TOM1/TOM3 domain-containing protein n=1 Tax=Saponaria officinalis TaxID=3572 RepID=A0AAW1KQP6_SAPOF
MSQVFIAVVSFIAALGFLLYGGRLFFMLRRFPIESKGRQKKLHEVLIRVTWLWTAIWRCYHELDQLQLPASPVFSFAALCSHFRLFSTPFFDGATVSRDAAFRTRPFYSAEGASEESIRSIPSNPLSMSFPALPVVPLFGSCLSWLSGHQPEYLPHVCL